MKQTAKIKKRPPLIWLEVLRENSIVNLAFVVLLGAATGLVSLLLAASYYGMPMFWRYFSNCAIMGLNLIPPVLLILLIYFISGRAWVSFSVSSLFVLVCSLINFFKIQIRTDPFIVADMSLFWETGNIISSYKLTMNWKVGVAVAFYALGLLFCIFFLKKKQKSAVFRIAGSVSVAVVTVAMYLLVFWNTNLYNNLNISKVSKDISPYSFSENFIVRGFVYPFIYSAKTAFPEKPEGYSRHEAEQLLNEYESAPIPDDKKVNVISIMLEAYGDLSRFSNVDFAVDVYGPLERIRAESVSGELIDNVFAGGTADTERLFLTGNTKMNKYSSNTNSYIWYLKSQGYFSEGLHAGDGWFYDRVAINKYLGMDEYHFLDEYPNGNRTDEFFFSEVRNLYDSRDKSRPYFSYSLSYQNHGAYDDQETVETAYINRGDLTEGSYNILNNYLSGICDTTERIESFINSFRDDPEPVVIVIFGDHMPWLGNFEAVYKELDVECSLTSVESFYNMYSTPYIIWANDAAKAATGGSFTGDGGSFSPCFLMNELFECLNWEGDGYMKAANELRERVDVINSATGLFRENGELTLTLSEEGKSMYDKLKKIEYFREHSVQG